MIQRPICIRRGRRTDFVAVMELLTASGAAVPVPERAALHRFRRLVADLGSDFYLATIDERVVGLTHITYARQLTAGPAATLAALIVSDSARGRGIGTALLQFALSRARKRACAELRCTVAERNGGGGQRLLLRNGGRPAGTVFEVKLTPEE